MIDGAYFALPPSRTEPEYPSINWDALPEMLPCKCCGEDPSLVTITTGAGKFAGYSVWCWNPDCEEAPESDRCFDAKEAAEDWNRRMIERD